LRKDLNTFTNIHVMEIINNKYKIISKIGEGTFGTIFKGENINTSELVAIKVEPIEKNTKLLKNETKIYNYLNNNIKNVPTIEGIPMVKWFGKDTKNYYMVMNLLGDSLEKRINQFRSFSLKLVLQIGIKIISLLKMIHDKGLIHRDIKPDNFLLGLKNEKKIYVIDFGFCKCYNRDRRHIEEKEVNNLIGSKMYASINAHNLIELSRRDDLESLGYMLVYFYLGNLPWQNIEEDEKIKKLKEKIINNVNLPDVLVNYIKYVRLLDFNETPNYYLIIENFKNEILSIVQNNNKK